MAATSAARAHGVARVAVVGAGIVGLATARALQQRLPGVDVTVFDKEPRVAGHQTGHNSGVVHAGIYYPPGSLKARLCTEGAELLRRYCSRKDLPYDACGKLIVALDEDESDRLRGLHERALANAVPGVQLLDPVRFREIEPHATGRLALHSPATAIVDFRAVAEALADDVRADGGTVHLATAVRRIRHEPGGVRLLTDRGVAAVDVVVNCAGLHADRVAQLAGDDADPRIVPFRGEYHLLRPGRRELVRGLIYPVPDPRYPFLGIHLTKRIDGEVLLGPNAVMALAREGYRWGDVSPGDLFETARWPGAWRLARAHWRTGIDEVVRSLSARRFVAEAQRYVPAIEPDDVVPGPSGVRAQALERNGGLVDDFRVSWQGRLASIRNAPSPAATSSLAIGRMIAGRVLADVAAL